MDPFRGQGGIQMLLTAEQEAQQIVSNARNLRTQRLKQAKDEAEREAALYKSHMESEYQKNLSETSGNSGSNVKRLEEETQAKINHLRASASKRLIKQPTEGVTSNKSNKARKIRFQKHFLSH